MLLRGASLAKWLANAERLWSEHGQAGISFTAQIDYYGKLTAQFPYSPIRVMYSASGTLPAATLLTEPRAIIEHALYYIRLENRIEAYYLLAILNSETARERAEGAQARGQWGARHFDKVIVSLPIPRFDASNKLHTQLAEAAAHAEQVAAGVQLSEGMHFVKIRQSIRKALQEDGIAHKIDELVARLLAQ